MWRGRTTDTGALTRLEWHRVSELEIRSRLSDGIYSADQVEVVVAGLSEDGEVAYEEARAMVLSSVDNCAAMKQASVMYQTDHCTALRMD